jgi:hypothetical protein
VAEEHRRRRLHASGAEQAHVLFHAEGEYLVLALILAEPQLPLNGRRNSGSAFFTKSA